MAEVEGRVSRLEHVLEEMHERLASIDATLREMNGRLDTKAPTWLVSVGIGWLATLLGTAVGLVLTCR